MKQKLLILTDWFPPAYKAGGPVQSVYNISKILKNQFKIYIITTATDLNEDISDKLTETDQFVESDGVYINYLTPHHRSDKEILRIIKEERPDAIFVNGLFNKYFSSIVLRLLISPLSKKLVLSTRGMLKPSAFRRKKGKKSIYLLLAKLLGIRKKAVFHVTSDVEENEVRDVFGSVAVASVIPNIPYQQIQLLKKKKSKSLKLVFAARVHPIKNLHMVLEAIEDLSCPVSLDIIGVINDEIYWNRCQSIVEKNDSVKVKYLGSINHLELMTRLQEYDVYILPTQGENFGHSIFEAFTNGLPVIISDQTPWTELKQKKVGFDLPLNQPDKFIEAIEFFAAMDQNEYDSWSINARDYASSFIENQNYIESYNDLFTVTKKIGIVAPIPITRYKGGISVIMEKILEQKHQFSEESIDIHFINTCKIPRSNESSGQWKLPNIHNYILFLWSAFQTINRENIGVIHMHSSIKNALLKDSFSLWLLKKYYSIHTIIQIHFAEPQSIYACGFKKKLTNYFLKHGANQILVLGENVSDMLVEEGIDKEKIKQVTYFHDRVLENTKQIKESTIHLLFLGSIDERKGILDVFTALVRLLDKDWELHIAGEFTSESFKKKLLQSDAYLKIKHKAHILGYVSGTAKERLLEKSDILVLPSYGEGLPISILEGLFYNLAILTTNVGANNEHLTEVANLLKPGDIASLTKELEKFISNPIYLKQRKEQAAKLSEKFTFAAFKKQILPIYQNI